MTREPWAYLPHKPGFLDTHCSDSQDRFIEGMADSRVEQGRNTVSWGIILMFQKGQSAQKQIGMFEKGKEPAWWAQQPPWGHWGPWSWKIHTSHGDRAAPEHAAFALTRAHFWLSALLLPSWNSLLKNRFCTFSSALSLAVQCWGEGRQRGLYTRRVDTWPVFLSG